jgi:beta-lactamase regulating signal transducer with metallopeptidase domain
VGTFIEVGLWNGVAAAVLALVAAGVSRLCRRPALTHRLWVLVLLKLLTPPLVPFALPWPTDEETGLLAEAIHPAPSPETTLSTGGDENVLSPAGLGSGDEASESVRELATSAPAAATILWTTWVGAAWLAGTAVWALWVVAPVIRFRRLLRLACRASEPLRAEAEDLAQRMGLRRCPEVWLVPGAVSPMVWGLGRRPCVLFPSGLLERLDDAGRPALLAHELAHVRRRDHWVRLLELVATGLYWWHPALWWTRRELHEAEEQCCDAWGVWAVGGDGHSYALALLQAVAFVSQARLPLPVGASGVGQVSHLKRRLAMIMQRNTSRSLSWAGLGAVLVLALLLPLFPARGQPAPGVQESRDQQIEALKLAIKLLEEQKGKEVPALPPQPRFARGPGAAPGEPPSGDAKALQAEIQEVDRAIAVKTKELRELQDRAHALQARLQGTEPRTSDPNRRNEFGRFPPSKTTPQPAGRVEDLEKKLDRLQKELEELRRELRPGRMPPLPGGSMAPGQPGGFGPPRPGMAPPGGFPPGPGGLPAFPGTAPAGSPPPGTGPAESSGSTPPAGPATGLPGR